MRTTQSTVTEITKEKGIVFTAGLRKGFIEEVEFEREAWKMVGLDSWERRWGAPEGGKGTGTGNEWKNLGQFDLARSEQRDIQLEDLFDTH